MNKSFKRDLLVWFVVFGILTMPFIFTDIDIVFQRPFFNLEDRWFLSKMPFWDFIYKYGIFLGYFLVVGALVMVSASYWNMILVKWRRPAFFLLFVMILGPGVLVNATLKDHWGHPRPREIKEFGGKENYVKVWVKGQTKGKSFPCGHASMGFFMSIPFLFLRNRYKKWAWVFFIFGTLYGTLIGIARMIAGGHFASDVLWAAGIVWLTGIISYYLLRTRKEPDLSNFDTPAQKKKRRLATILMGIVLPVITVALLLATPYISNREFTKQRAELDNIEMKTLLVDFNEGIVNVGFGDDFIVDFSVHAFGFPNSKIGWDWKVGDTTSFNLTHMGWFTEVRNEIELQIPQQSNWSNTLLVNEGDVYLEITEDTIPRNLKIIMNEGDINLIVKEKSTFILNSNSSEVQNNTTIQLDELVTGRLNLDLTILKKGSVIINYKE